MLLRKDGLRSGRTRYRHSSVDCLAQRIYNWCPSVCGMSSVANFHSGKIKDDSRSARGHYSLERKLYGNQREFASKINVR